VVYKIDGKDEHHKVLAYHRESVRCLVRLSQHYFVSASLDGAIIVWSCEALAPFKIIVYPEHYRDDNRKYIYDVRFLLPMGERYIAAAIGHGFKVYDALNGDCLIDCKQAHEAEVTHLSVLYERYSFDF
jgi:WD40 repeat protein